MNTETIPAVRKFEVCFAVDIAPAQVEADTVEWSENLKFKRNGEVVAVFFCPQWFKETQ